MGVCGVYGCGSGSGGGGDWGERRERREKRCSICRGVGRVGRCRRGRRTRGVGGGVSVSLRVSAGVLASRTKSICKGRNKGQTLQTKHPTHPQCHSDHPYLTLPSLRPKHSLQVKQVANSLAKDEAGELEVRRGRG